ncbi:MAG: HNH endonuclease [Planctomycetes bacterium]|nr:HNH endonuclease [Planctomycetota bacterium]
MNAVLARLVRERAGYVCEYCRIPQQLYPAPFEIDHIIAKQHDGPTRANNLALSCLHCNGHKGPNIAGLDPVTKRLVRLFNPRRQRWTRHFRRTGPILIGRTPIGRVTVRVLNMNGPYLVALRKELMDEGHFT